MRSQSHRTNTKRPIAWWVLGVVVLLQLFCGSAGAQNIESIMAPGKVITGHVKVEDECKQCHVKFDRKAQDGLCMGCHKDVGSDVRGKAGFHGRLSDTTCRSCHTDHKGRDAQVAPVDKKNFDHRKTDFVLHGKHEKAECVKCHVAGKKYREASLECSVCHKKDDDTKGHKGALGTKCADCHSESSWKETRFDHDTTHFSLTGKHSDAKCADCHKNGVYKDTPKNCFACHRKDDDGKGHKGQFGEKCDSCHTSKQWKPSTFNHDADTKYQLRGKHRNVVCKDCHTGNLFRDKLTQDCVSCHKKDDKHKESLGKDCAQCHTERNWKEPAKFDHALTTFPLLGKHADVVCKECHTSVMFKEAPKECFACHKKDDKHKDTLGKDCAQCHTEKDWKTTAGRFQHDKTRFVLRNQHALASVKCDACHKSLQNFRNTPLDCLSCHKKDDKHEGQLGLECGKCHSDRGWKTTRFDHNKSRFALTGRHTLVECKKCHETSRYKDASRECAVCHKKDDTHKQKFGVRCETCHNTRAWAVWKFDHAVKSKYPLEGAHGKVACESCHQKEAAKDKDIAPLDRSCASCHRSVDVHEGKLGVRCEQCHSVDSWKNFKNRVSHSGFDGNWYRESING
jgi:hypothetical protein